MKRKQWTICIAMVFVTWNALAYLFVARGPQQQDEEYVDDTARRLNLIEQSIKDQVQQESILLKQFEEIKNRYKQEILQFKPRQQRAQDTQNIPSNNNDAAVAGGVVQQQQQQQPSPNPAALALSDVDLNSVVLPILVIACNRDTVTRTIDELLKYRPSSERFPIIVSQDCGHAGTAAAIKSYGAHVTLIQHPNMEAIALPSDKKKFMGYYKIARHFKWALSQVFDKLGHRAVIIVEDDLDIAPDFFEYFSATYPILHSDPSLWCVSAWHDNGKVNMIQDDPELLYRTDFFPGLGWMLEKSTWDEIKANWPVTFWDDWMRHPDQRKDRSCIRPEISRTHTFGKKGVSNGQFYEKHLKFIKLNEQLVPFTKKDLSYLIKNNYDSRFVTRVYSAPLLTLNQVLTGQEPEKTEVRVQYDDKQSFKTQAKKLGIMEDLKSGVPRAGYRGVVSFMYNDRHVFFCPPPSWSGYDITWS